MHRESVELYWFSEEDGSDLISFLFVVLIIVLRPQVKLLKPDSLIEEQSKLPSDEHGFSLKGVSRKVKEILHSKLIWKKNRN